MKISDEQIANLLCQDVISKTILVQPDELKNVISSHTKDGWKIVKQSDLNGKIKVTFQKKKH